MPRVEIDTQAPDFELEDLDGELVRLSSFLGKKNVLLVFNRGLM
jgi:peroxiredoxin